MKKILKILKELRREADIPPPLRDIKNEIYKEAYNEALDDVKYLILKEK